MAISSYFWTGLAQSTAFTPNQPFSNSANTSAQTEAAQPSASSTQASAQGSAEYLRARSQSARALMMNNSSKFKENLRLRRYPHQETIALDTEPHPPLTSSEEKLLNTIRKHEKLFKESVAHAGQVQALVSCVPTKYQGAFKDATQGVLSVLNQPLKQAKAELDAAKQNLHEN
jgi:hypothetical protein